MKCYVIFHKRFLVLCFQCILILTYILQCIIINEHYKQHQSIIMGVSLHKEESPSQ